VGNALIVRPAAGITADVTGGVAPVPAAAPALFQAYRGDEASAVRWRATLVPATPLALTAPATTADDVVARVLRPEQVKLLAALKTRGLLSVVDRQGVPLLDHLQRLATSPLLMPDADAEQALIVRQQAAQKALDDWTAAHPATLTEPEQAEKKRLQQAVKLVTTAPFKLDAAAYRAEVLGALLQHYQDPHTETDQGNFGTCAPAIAQRHMVNEDPADYARLVADLFIDGKTVMGRQTYELNRENLIRVGNDNPAVTSWARDWVDMAVQSSLIDGETPGTYDKVTENMARPAEVANGVPQGRGLSSEGRVRLQRNLLDGDFTFVDSEDAARAGTNSAAVALLRSELDAAERRQQAQAATIAANGLSAVPEPVFVEIRINWGSATAPGSHAVAVVGRTATHVLIDNPQGNLFGLYKRQKKYPVVTDPDNGKAYVDLSANTKMPPGMRVYEDGLTAFPWETMNQHLWGVYTRKR
jgi:hypothetical protein